MCPSGTLRSWVTVPRPWAGSGPITFPTPLTFHRDGLTPRGPDSHSSPGEVTPGVEGRRDRLLVRGFGVRYLSGRGSRFRGLVGVYCPFDVSRADPWNR